MHKITKIALISVSILVVFVVLAIVFISPITKYLVEKYDEQYTGRQITMKRAYVNPFTGYIYFSDLKIYEFKSDSLFFSANGMSANIAIFKLLSKNYEIESVTFDKPHGLIAQNKKNLNFNDLIVKFTAQDTLDSLRAPLHLNILNVKVNNGEFHYCDERIPINYFIKNVNFESTGKRWNVDTIATKFSFSSGIGTGDAKGDFTFNTKTDDYHFAAVINKFDLQIIEQYLQDLTNYGSFTANLDADIRSSGNFSNREKVNSSGRLAINDFHFGKTPKDDYAAFDKLVVAINEINPSKFIYNYDSVMLYHPYFKYERYDKLDNLQTMFGKGGYKITEAKANTTQFNLIIEIANYIKMLSRNFFKSHYRINRLAIYKGDLKFNDFSGSEKFSMALNPLFISADSIDKKYNRVKLHAHSDIKPFGQAKASLSMDPKDSSNFDLRFNFQKMPVSMFNAYIIAYTSFPLDRGTLEFNGKWHVRNSIIKSQNHVLIVDPRVGKRVKNKDGKWIPARLIMAFVRERGNVIDYNVPITGSLKDPKFHFKDAIWDLVRNIFIKPPTTPYGIAVKSTEREIEKLLTLKWEMRQSSLTFFQRRFIKKMANFLEDNPDASIGVFPQDYVVKEKEYILFFEAKKKYFKEINNINSDPLSKKDSTTVDRMSVKDAAFVGYLKKHINGANTFTIQEKCAKLIGLDIVNAKLKQLNAERMRVFMTYFDKNDVAKRVKIQKTKDVVPYDGFSFYKIDYKGELPKSLTKAYQRMNKLNDESPRKEFEKKREKNAHVLK